MPKVTAQKQAQHSRKADHVAINLTLDAEAAAILRRHCPPGRRGTGRFVSRLLYEHEARVQERERRGQQNREMGEGDQRTE